jgi:hypothetical protein
MFNLKQSWPRLVAFLVILVFCVGTLCADDAPPLPKEQIKQFLLSAKVVHVSSAKKGITNTKRLTLSDGTITHDASFQTIDEHQAFKQFANGTSEVRFIDSYKYNIAAYKLAELIGFDDMMPVYVERKYAGQPGSLSWWLSVKMDEADRLKQKLEPPDQEAWNKQMYKIRVFDELVYDNDPNLTNVLISADWKIWRIDFTRAFVTIYSRAGALGLAQSRTLAIYGEFGVEIRCRIFAGPNIEGAWLDDPLLALRTPELQFVLAKRELECFRFSRLEPDTFEALQLAYGS